MKKMIHIAWKDLILAYRRLFLVGMAFIAPMLLAFIVSSAFGGGSGFNIARIDLGIVNLDIPSFDLSAGELMVEFLTGDDLSDLLNPVVYPSEDASLEAIRAQEVQATVIIPENLSAAMTGESSPAQIRLLHDPALSLAPQIVEGILVQMADGFSGARITSDLIVSEFINLETVPDARVIEKAVDQYTNRATDRSQSATGYIVSQPESEETETRSLKDKIVAGVMAAMMIFFTFFTGAYGAGTILDEEVDGTLARKITAPLSLSEVLGGKSLGVIFILLLQMVVLVTISSVIFNIDWGTMPGITLAILSTTVASAGLGLFLMSLVRTRNQTEIIFGGVLTVLGMGGGLFTGSAEDLPPFMDVITLITPQGWSKRVWLAVQDRIPLGQVLPDALILLAIGLVLFAIGMLLFRRRFAR